MLTLRLVDIFVYILSTTLVLPAIICTSTFTLSALCASSSFSRLSLCATQALSLSSSSWNWAMVTSRFSSTAFSIWSSALSLVFSSSVLRRWAYTYGETVKQNWSSKNADKNTPSAGTKKKKIVSLSRKTLLHLIKISLILLILQLALQTVSLCCQLL